MYTVRTLNFIRVTEWDLYTFNIRNFIVTGTFILPTRPLGKGGKCILYKDLFYYVNLLNHNIYQDSNPKNQFIYPLLKFFTNSFYFYNIQTISTNNLTINY